MRLADVINTLKAAALGQPAIQQVVENDVYRLNAEPSVQYGVFGYVQGTHRSEGADLMRWSFTLLYIDRLTEDRGNEVEVQSTGIAVLQNITRAVEAALGTEAQDIEFTPFTERFADECAGQMARVSFVTPGEPCEEIY